MVIGKCYLQLTFSGSMGLPRDGVSSGHHKLFKMFLTLILAMLLITHRQASRHRVPFSLRSSRADGRPNSIPWLTDAMRCTAAV